MEPIRNKALKSSIQELPGTEFLNKILPHMVGLFLTIGIIIFFFILLIGATQWIMSGGDKAGLEGAKAKITMSGGDKAGLEGAKAKITNAFIGIIILLAVFVLIKLIEDFFGINILTINIGALYIE